MSIAKIATNFSSYNRLRKYNFFIDYFKPTINTKILDIGAAEIEYQENANTIEKKYPYPENITVLGIDDYKEFSKRYPKVKAVTYKGNEFPFKDKEFDICWCNAVIEHIGGINEQKKFLKEINRACKAVFITTPNKHFPFEVHTKIFLLHYLPKRIFDKILIMVGKPWASGNYMHLLSLNTIKKLLEECGIEKYRIVKNKILGFTVDFMIIF